MALFLNLWFSYKAFIMVPIFKVNPTNVTIVMSIMAFFFKICLRDSLHSTFLTHHHHPTFPLGHKLTYLDLCSFNLHIHFVGQIGLKLAPSYLVISKEIWKPEFGSH